MGMMANSLSGRTLPTAVFSSLLVLGLAGGFLPAQAQQTQQPPASAAQEQPPQAQQDLAQLEQMIGQPLYNQDGEQLGDIDELAQDRNTGQTVAVVSTGGFLGLGEEQIAVPTDRIQVENGRATTVQPTSQQDLEQMASFDPQQYQSMGGAEVPRG